MADLERTSKGGDADSVDVRINLSVFRARINQLEAGEQRMRQQVAEADQEVQAFLRRM